MRLLAPSEAVLTVLSLRGSTSGILPNPRSVREASLRSNPNSCQAFFKAAGDHKHREAG
jgi:hypothetical protein